MSEQKLLGGIPKKFQDAGALPGVGVANRHCGASSVVSSTLRNIYCGGICYGILCTLRCTLLCLLSMGVYLKY